MERRADCKSKARNLSIYKNSFMPLFLLTKKAQKKKLGKKKSAEKEISRSAEREEGVAPPPHKLLKKFDQNFSLI